AFSDLGPRKWPTTHERTASTGGALFSPRVRPALRRADPVARRAPARPRRGRRLAGRPRDPAAFRQEQHMAVTVIFNGQPHERVAAENAVFGHALQDADHAELGGNIQDDAEVQVWYNQPWSLVQGISRIQNFAGGHQTMFARIAALLLACYLLGVTGAPIRADE